jgi:hypothetical protein
MEIISFVYIFSLFVVFIPGMFLKFKFVNYWMEILISAMLFTIIFSLSHKLINLKIYEGAGFGDWLKLAAVTSSTVRNDVKVQIWTSRHKWAGTNNPCTVSFHTETGWSAETLFFATIKPKSNVKKTFSVIGVPDKIRLTGGNNGFKYDLIKIDDNLPEGETGWIDGNSSSHPKFRIHGFSHVNAVAVESARLVAVESARLAAVESARLASIESARLASIESARLASGSIAISPVTAPSPYGRASFRQSTSLDGSKFYIYK